MSHDAEAAIKPDGMAPKNAQDPKQHLAAATAAARTRTDLAGSLA
jgi:hypothetical protein